MIDVVRCKCFSRCAGADRIKLSALQAAEPLVSILGGLEKDSWFKRALPRSKCTLSQQDALIIQLFSGSALQHCIEQVLKSLTVNNWLILVLTLIISCATMSTSKPIPCSHHLSRSTSGSQGEALWVSLKVNEQL